MSFSTPVLTGDGLYEVAACATDDTIFLKVHPVRSERSVEFDWTFHPGMCVEAAGGGIAVSVRALGKSLHVSISMDSSKARVFSTALVYDFF